MAVVGVFPYDNGQTFVGGIVNKKNQGHLLPVPHRFFGCSIKLPALLLVKCL